MVSYVNIGRFDQLVKHCLCDVRIFLAAIQKFEPLSTYSQIKSSSQMSAPEEFLFLMESSDDDRMGDVVSSRVLSSSQELRSACWYFLGNFLYFLVLSDAFIYLLLTDLL